MDYEKKYKEALKKAKDNYNAADKANINVNSFKNTLISLFPELKESEDERMWKLIKKYAHSNISDMALNADHITRDQLESWLEKQGKQKNVDNVEPKFKVGNWYLCTKDFFGKGVIFDKNIAYYCAKEGCLQDEYECHIAIVKDLYDNFKLWTIEDAKDGDVLQLGEVTAIFKEFIGGGNCRCYCSICNGEFEIPSQDGADNSYGCHNASPATEEQRDLLFQKIKEAGYEFDFEKKKLKEIEQMPAEWSEEDEKERKRVVGLLEGWLSTIKETYYAEDCKCGIEWLESLKDRYTYGKSRNK